MDKYSSYKDSGVKWLGEVPSHWELRHLRNFLTVFSEKGYGDSQLLSVTRERGVILRDKENKEENHNFVPDDLSGYKHLNAGDFVINKMKSWQGSYGVSEYDGIVSPAYFTCKLKGVSPQFFSRAIRSKAYIGFFMQYSKGIRVDQWDLDPNSMKDIPFVLPPLSEQNAIASYLDSVTTQIDTAIAQQKKMIELLNERKQIIINNAVTKGLDPNVKMKDSGVDWIGEIPEGWEVRRLGSIGSTINGVSHDSSYFGEGDPFVSYSDVYKNYSLPKSVSGLAKSSIQERKIFSVEKGDVFFTRTSETAEEIGLTSVCLETISNAVFAGFLIRFRPQADLLAPDFSMYYFRAHIHRSYFVKEMNLVIRASLSQQLLRGLPVLLPPLQEQIKIANFLNCKINEIDSCIKSKTMQITLLQERKQIIINEVVTGKVKVS